MPGKPHRQKEPGGLQSLGLQKSQTRLSNSTTTAAAIFSCVYMCHAFFIQSSADGHLGGFHVLAIVNDAAWFRSSSQDKHAHILSCNWPWSVTPWRLLEIRVSVHIWLFPSSAPRTEHRGHGGSTAGLCFSLMSHFKTKVEHREAPLKL